MEGVTIREATVQDAAVLAGIAASTFQETFANDNSEEDMMLFLEKTYGVRQQTEELQDSKCLFLLAFKYTDCIGFSKLIFETPPDATVDMSVLGIDNTAIIENIELSKCYLRKAHHGTGIADKLMTATLEAVPKRISQKKSDQTSADKKMLVWLGVWEFNPRAIKFYTRYGFKKVGVHPFVLGNDVQND
eukprot:TRINITY_DN9156_c0_g1_i1.p1 TRINITY_DN9156_c0_g1~~TRINITY_DN9156_c0_g1_i1.p1  ORF type:complete len:189 (+),score=12.97 TRINITY_DN9156_c0_g1_i1:27-593(+)